MRILNYIEVNQSDFFHEAGQEFIRPFSVVFGHSYTIKDDINAEHTSTIKKVITIFVAVIILPLTFLFAAMGAIMIGCSPSHKKAYKQIQEQQDRSKINTPPISNVSSTSNVNNAPHVVVSTSLTAPSVARNVDTTELVKEETLRINLFIKERGLQEKIFLNARYHLQPFSRPCAYPRILYCGTPYVNRNEDDLRAQSRGVLFFELSIDLQDRLNALEMSEKQLILDQVIDNQMTEYKEIIHQMEKDLFSFLKQTDLLNTLRFDRQELDFCTLDASIEANLRQHLEQPLSQRLNQFDFTIQSALLTSAYCQLKKEKTGKGDVIDLS